MRAGLWGLQPLRSCRVWVGRRVPEASFLGTQGMLECGARMLAPRSGLGERSRMEGAEWTRAEDGAGEPLVADRERFLPVRPGVRF